MDNLRYEFGYFFGSVNRIIHKKVMVSIDVIHFATLFGNRFTEFHIYISRILINSRDKVFS